MRFAKGAGIGASLLVALALAACSPAGEKKAAEAAAPESAASDALPTDSMPKPKVGKWKMTMNIAGAPGPQSIEVCYTQKMLDEMQGMAGDMPNTECGKASVTREGAAWVTKVSCASGGRQSTVITRAQGDFDRRYTVDMSMTSDPPDPGGSVSTTTTAEYLGPC